MADDSYDSDHSLFSDGGRKSYVDSDGDNLMDDAQNFGHEPHSIPFSRLDEIADAIIAFYDGDDLLEHEQGTQLYRLFQHLRGGPIKLKPKEESNRVFLRLLREQPDGPPPVQDNDLPPDEAAVKERLQYETDKLIENLIKEGKLAPDYANVDGARSSSPVAEDPQSENDSDTGDGFQQNQSLNLSHGQRSPPREYAGSLQNQSLNLPHGQWSPPREYAWGEGLSLSQANVVNEPIDFDEDFDPNLLTQSPDGSNKDKGRFNIPDLRQRPRANFIATPLGWSLLETPSCS